MQLNLTSIETNPTPQSPGKMQADETLNLEYWTREYVVRALNRNSTIVEAAYDLGISERQLYKLRARFLINKQQDGRYYYKETYDTRKLCGTYKTIEI